MAEAGSGAAAKWAEFREQVIELDGGACRRCTRKRADGAILQVHHKKYLIGRLPWDYPYEIMETLCKRCHAAEHGHIPPQSGWMLVDTDDLGGLDGVCDDCSEPIRHVYFIEHVDWPVKAVGCHCCDRLTGTNEASLIEYQRGLKERRRRNLIKSKRWSSAGNIHSIFIKAVLFEVRLLDSGWAINVNQQRGKRRYKTLEEAKTVVFDLLDSGSIERLIARQKRALRAFNSASNSA